MDYFSPLGITPPAQNATGIPITFVGACPGGVTAIRVEIANYTFTPITPLLALIGASTINLTASATYRWERSP